MINEIHLLEGLRQLASRELQQKFWLEGKNNQMSSFTEAISHVFDDSGVARAIESDSLEEHFPASVCSKLTELRRIIHEIPENVAPQEIIEHPRMIEIRSLAAELMNLLAHKAV